MDGLGFAYRTLTCCGPTFQRVLLAMSNSIGSVLLPRACIATHAVWALPRSLATTGGITVVFFSSGY